MNKKSTIESYIEK